MRKFDISILICTRNSEKSIKSVIDSIHALDEVELICEILVIDHESFDNTKWIVEGHSATSLVGIKLLNCLIPGKSPALIMGLNNAKGDYSIIVDDDNILAPNFVANIIPTLLNQNVGIIGTKGVVDPNLVLPKWFNTFAGCYAVGCVSDKPIVEWVWGAGCVVKMEAWEILKSRNFSFILNPARASNSTPIAIGGEDVELALAIRLIGFQAKVCPNAEYIHMVPQSRVNESYLINNAKGVSRATPIHNIYRLLISNNYLANPFLMLNLMILRNILGNLRAAVYCLIVWDILKVRYHLSVLKGLVEGYHFYRNDFFKTYNNLKNLKNYRET